LLMLFKMLNQYGYLQQVVELRKREHINRNNEYSG
jgi:hypothetical protein